MFNFLYVIDRQVSSKFINVTFKKMTNITVLMLLVPSQYYQGKKYKELWPLCTEGGFPPLYKKTLINRLICSNLDKYLMSCIESTQVVKETATVQ